ncbi:MAG: type II toxin-antitoxin system VapC family toxin [Firmicutes bacterium]|jgi:predicted nucleic acid-binding protein|nr:type II toxin-antitoxin system VapC family toxin [Bacillota bacterium]
MRRRTKFESCVCVDASLVVKWLVDEPDSHRALALLEEWIVQGTRLIAPSLLDYEVGSVLRKLAARGVLPIDSARERLHLYEALDIELLSPPFIIRRAWELSVGYGLYTVYDASYVALAELTGTRLYTCDGALVRALGGSTDMIINPLDQE